MDKTRLKAHKAKEQDKANKKVLLVIQTLAPNNQEYVVLLIFSTSFNTWKSQKRKFNVQRLKAACKPTKTKLSQSGF
jgi:hypothetical protein